MKGNERDWGVPCNTPGCDGTCATIDKTFCEDCWDLYYKTVKPQLGINLIQALFAVRRGSLVYKYHTKEPAPKYQIAIETELLNEVVKEYFDVILKAKEEK